MGQKKRTKSSDVVNLEYLNTAAKPTEADLTDGKEPNPDFHDSSTLCNEDVEPICTPVKKPWKKILYENSDYPDNYTDVTFLEELRKNLHFQEIKLSLALSETLVVSRQIAVLVSFVLAFVHLENIEWRADLTFGATTLVTAIMYGYTVKIKLSQNVFRDLRLAVIFLLVTYTLSPVLRTLTDTISTDTIYATTAFMFILNVIFKNYHVQAHVVSDTFSTNTAIFGSVCLASRLPTYFHAFVLLTLAAEVFVLLPILTHQINIHPVLSIAHISTISVWLFFVSPKFSLIFLLFICFINLLCPFWYCKWQREKANLYGPWDEAIIKSEDTEHVKL